MRLRRALRYLQVEEGACVSAKRLSLPVLDGKFLQTPLEHCHLGLDGLQLRLLDLIAQCLVRALHKQIAWLIFVLPSGVYEAGFASPWSQHLAAALVCQVACACWQQQ